MILTILAQLEEIAHANYETQIIGRPQAFSEWDQCYETVRVTVNSYSQAEQIAQLVDVYEGWMKRHPGKVIVWRIKPAVTIKDGDSEEMRLRFRAHVLKELVPPSSVDETDNKE